MNSSHHQLSALEEMFSSSLLGECYDLEELAQWCHEPWPQLPLARQFREQLRATIEQEGLLAPKVYETWTDDRSYPTQEKLQTHLKKIWNACFPDEKLS